MLIAFVIAFLASSAAAPWIVRGARRSGLVNAPTDPRHIHTRAVPRFGGIAVYAGTSLGVVLALAAHPGAFAGARQDFFLSILAGGTVLFLTGLVDDALGMRPVTKLGLQVVAATAAYLVGHRIDALSFGSHTSVAVGWLSFPLTVLWIVGVTNAFNLIDGLDGLATGIGVVVLATVAAAATLLHNADVVLVCLALLGALLGFLRFNLSPARLFLGDSGSLFVGFMLAMLSLHGSLKGATTVVIAVPVFALAVPLLDVLLAVTRRWLRGAPIFGADARHLHHRLLAMGLAPSRAATVLCAVAAAFAVYGLSLAFAPPPAVLAVSLVGGTGTLVLVLLGIWRLNYHEFSEAGVVLASGIKRARRVVRDQILARETAQLVSKVPSLAALNGVLASRAAAFGFVRMEVGRERELTTGSRRPRNADGPVRTWTLNVPVSPPECDAEDPFILRIACDQRRGYRPFAAERVARTVGAAVEEWIRTSGVMDTVPTDVGAHAAASELGLVADLPSPRVVGRDVAPAGARHTRVDRRGGRSDVIAVAS